MLIHCMDGDRVGRVIKTKIIVEFNNYFFSASQANYIKPSVVTLHQPLPQRLPGVGWADSPMICRCSSEQPPWWWCLL